MAPGSRYPAEFQTDSGVVVEGGAIQFTDADNQPGSPLPAIVSAADLPTADPMMAGQVWWDQDNAVLAVSGG